MLQGAMRLRALRSDAALLALAIAAYFLGTLAVTEWGNYPVPVMGAGAGPVLGWYAALGILQCAERAERAANRASESGRR
jgi:hypothetical protein